MSKNASTALSGIRLDLLFSRHPIPFHIHRICLLSSLFLRAIDSLCLSLPLRSLSYMLVFALSRTVYHYGLACAAPGHSHLVRERLGSPFLVVREEERSFEGSRLDSRGPRVRAGARRTALSVLLLRPQFLALRTVLLVRFSYAETNAGARENALFFHDNRERARPARSNRRATSSERNRPMTSVLSRGLPFAHARPRYTRLVSECVDGIARTRINSLNAGIHL